jgi:putative transposase
VTLLRQIEVVTARCRSISIAFREAGISEQSYFRWRKEYGGLNFDQVKKMMVLELENTHMKGLVADLSPEKQVLKEVRRENLQARVESSGGHRG